MESVKDPEITIPALEEARKPLLPPYVGKEILFPFAAIVNQEKAKEALLYSLINPAVHGVLLLGEKGTGKTTLVRSLSTLLPGIRVVEMPLGSGEEMVLGTVDAEKTLATGKVAIKTGILSRADKQILYIDEVNLLPDHLMDVILDAAATGRYRLEREGISQEFKARFVLVGTMNPEEGWLRPQLLDRFGLAVHVSSLSSVEGRAEVFNRAQAFESAPHDFITRFNDEQQRISKQLHKARERVKQVKIPEELLVRTLKTIMETGIGTHRAELSALRAAQARAAWYGRGIVSWEDVQSVIPMALQHRLPWKDIQHVVTWEEIEERVYKGGRGAEDRSKNGWLHSPFYRKKKSSQRGKKIIHMGANVGKIPAPIKDHEKNPKRKISTPKSLSCIKKAGPIQAGGHSRFRREAPSDKGRKHTHRPWRKGRIDEIATLFHAWKFGRFRPTPEDLRGPVFSTPQVRLIIFLLDISDSMAETRELARTWTEKFLNEAYFRRDPTAIVTVQGISAKILVQPTTSLQFILHQLSSLEENGGTPLRQGILMVERLIRQWHNRYQVIDLYILSDGRSTEPLEGPELTRSLFLIHRFVRDVVVVNPVSKAASFARNFSALIGATYMDPWEFLKE